MTEAVFFKEVEEIKPGKLGRFVLPTSCSSSSFCPKSGG